jgi:1-phosphofructokinase
MDREADEQVTICVFAPVPLLTVTMERAADNRDELHVHAGGQGFWVARMLTALGARAVLCGPFGGETGAIAAYLMRAEGVEVREIAAGSPNAGYVHDRRDGERDELMRSSFPALGRHELDELYNLTLAESMAAGTCVLTGTQLLDAVPADTYRRLASDLAANGVSLVADLSGEQAAAAVAGGLDLLKISDEELVSGGWAPRAELGGIVDGIRALVGAGARNVVVSRASEGSIGYLDGRWLHANGPVMEVVDARGAGDSMTAALAYAYAAGAGLADALCLAAAAGAANVTRHGLASGHADTIHALASRVEVKPLEGLAPCASC